jgi:hypothetical protein
LLDVERGDTQVRHLVRIVAQGLDEDEAAVGLEVSPPQ